MNKITKFNRKNSIDADNIGDQSVGDFEIISNSNGESVIKTSFTCPVCETEIACLYNQYWQVSNLEKHIKKHQTRKLPPGAAAKLGQILNKDSLGDSSQNQDQNLGQNTAKNAVASQV